jgi:UDP-glucose 4-epimerase
MFFNCFLAGSIFLVTSCFDEEGGYGFSSATSNVSAGAVIMRAFVTGAAGFIGSNLVDRLVSAGHAVVGADNFSSGQRRFLKSAGEQARFEFVEMDLLDRRAVTAAMAGCDIVFHLAANADVRFGTNHTFKDIEQNVIVTYNVLEAMRSAGTRKIVFSSTGSVYGEAAVFPTPEDAPFPVQTSLYGTSKIAAEGLISSYSEAFEFQAFIFRFVSILGERYTHGHVFDFYRKLLLDSSRLEVLGNGKQRKSYLYVQDCVDAILIALERATERVNILNLGQNEFCEVNQSIAWICETLKVKPDLHYTGGERGWVGDNAFIFLDCSRMSALGWEPKVSIREGVIKTLRYLMENRWVLEAR